MNSNNKIPGRGWGLVSTAWGVTFLASFGVYCLGMLLPTLEKDFNFGLDVAGSLSSILFIVMTITYIPIALIAARVKPKYVLAFVFACMAISLLIQGLAQTTGVLILGRGIMAIGVAGILAPLVLIKTNWVPRARFAQLNGYENFVVTFSQLIATAGTTFLVLFFGNWRNLIVTAGVIGIALTVIWLIFYKENPAVGALQMPAKQSFGAPLKKALKEKSVWLLGLGWPGTTLVWIAFATFWPSYAVKSFGFSMVTAGLLVGILPMASCLACLTSPKLTNWIGYDKLMIWPWGFILPVVYFLSLQTSNIPILCVLFFVAGYGAYAFIPIAITVLYKLPKLDTGSISASVSIVQTTTSIGGAAAGILIGSLGISLGLQSTLVICCLGPLTLGILTLFMPELGRKATEKKAKLAAQEEKVRDKVTV